MQKTTSTVLALLATAWLTAAHAGTPGPSFSCDKAQTDTEKAICGDPLLAALDLAVARAYSALLAAKPADASAIRTNQREMIVKRDACDADTGCIAGLLEQRLDAMIQATGTPGEPAKPGTYNPIPAASGASIDVKSSDGTVTMDASAVDGSNGNLCSMSSPAAASASDGGYVFVDKDNKPIDGAPVITALGDLLVLRGGTAYCGANVTWPMLWSE